jgi:hydrogenase nickel incorporation protein HypB
MKSNKKSKRINVVTKILEANDRVAEENRRIFSKAGTYVIDVMGSPGAGKTMLLEAALPILLDGMHVGVIAGDIETTLDAQRIAAFDIPVVQATTGAFGGSCHMEASTVRQAADQLDLNGLDLVFVENVGNLVCPAEFDIGQSARVVVLSVTEGEDKPLKYPLAFRTADLVVVNKIDLIPHLDLDMTLLRRNLQQVKPGLKWVELCARSGDGIMSWVDWIHKAMNESKAPTAR